MENTEDATRCDGQGSIVRQQQSEVPLCSALPNHRGGDEELVREILGETKCCHPTTGPGNGGHREIKLFKLLCPS